MTGLQGRKGFTLMEVLVAIGIVTVLATIIFPVFARARGSVRAVRCLSNLQQISLATKVYYEEHGGPPMARLPLALGSYVKGDAVFVCPDDPQREDSYSAFFVGRPRAADSTEFLVGCPRHSHGRKSATASGQGKSNVGVAGPIVWESGKNKKDAAEIISPGQVVEEGTLRFADGSVVVVDKKLTAVVLSSVTEDHVLHTVVYIRPSESKGQIQVSVNHGSNFEVITPEICAAVRGTRFTVDVEKSYQKSKSLLVVSDGLVEVKSRTRSAKYKLKGGQWGYEEQPAVSSVTAVSGPWGY